MNNGYRYNFYFMCGFLIVFLLGCGERLEVGAEIRDFGEYRYKSGETLFVSEQSGFVKYSLLDKNNVELIGELSRASAYQMWVIVWEGESLWFSSSDIGSFMWTKSIDGEFVKKIGQIDSPQNKIK